MSKCTAGDPGVQPCDEGSAAAAALPAAAAWRPWPHSAFERLCGDALISYPHDRSVARAAGAKGAAAAKRLPASVCVVTVGSGLLMATCDEVVRLGAGWGLRVHCAVDVGRRSIREMAQAIEWAAHVQGHDGVLVHTYHSLSSGGALKDWLLREYPSLWKPGRRVPVALRIVGRDVTEPPPSLAQVLHDLAMAIDMGRIDRMAGMDT